MSMLVPLETLAGTTNPTALQSLGLLVGFPALAFVIIALLGRASTLAKAGRVSSPEVADPVWLGGPGSKELTDGRATAGVSGQASGTGGASARW